MSKHTRDRDPHTSPRHVAQRATRAPVSETPAGVAQRRETAPRDVSGAMPSMPWHAGQRPGDGAPRHRLQPRATEGGLPVELRAGLEAMSGLDMSDVRVHLDSSAPAQLGALAFARGEDIHLGPGQERHLPHEAWHVVQQKQGRVPATTQLKGASLNADPALEREADVMGARAAQTGGAMHTSSAATPGVTSSAAPVQRVVQRVVGLRVGDRVRVPIETGEQEYTVRRASREAYDLESDTHDRMESVPEWKVLPAVIDESVGEKREHVLTEDGDVQRWDRWRANTPGGMKQDAERTAKHKQIVGPDYVATPFTDTARIDVDSTAGEAGLELRLSVTCNPEYMCVVEGGRRDLVPIYLELGTDHNVDLIAVVEPTDDANACTLTATYPWKNLARLLQIAETDGARKRQLEPLVDETDNEMLLGELARLYPELGVKAQWMAARTRGDTNSQNHTSGGRFEKGGSGKVLLKAYSREELLDAYEEAESQRYTEWNMGAMLRPGRPIYDDYAQILQYGEEMATTLEAESEYIVEASDFERIVARMKAIEENPGYWKHFEILNMTGTVKEYTDTYYDFVGTGEHDHTMLRHGGLLRRRHVDTDDPNTFLFSVKGRAEHKSGDLHEMIRLAAQMNLDESALETEEGQEAFVELITTPSIDNPFARVVEDLLGGEELSELREEAPKVAPVLTIVSRRHKFSMELDGSTAIDFSADEATATLAGSTDGRSAKLYSFEFGVGHPGLTATQTGGSGGSNRNTGISRPYHVPGDLDNGRLYQKRDYKQYQELRDSLIEEALSVRKGDLRIGGNKATVLARELGLLPAEESSSHEGSSHDDELLDHVELEGGSTSGGLRPPGRQPTVPDRIVPPVTTPEVVTRDPSTLSFKERMAFFRNHQ